MNTTFKNEHRWLTGWLICVIVYSTHFSLAFSQTRSVIVEPPEDSGASEGSPGKTLLFEAKWLYEGMEWEAAQQKCKEALEAGLNREDRAEAYWYLAVLAHANDDYDAAEDYMVEVLRANPDFALPVTLLGTDFEPIFNTALSRADSTPPTIKILSPKTVTRNQPTQVTAEISDASPIVWVKLSYQRPDEQAETTVAMKSIGQRRWSGEISRNATKKGETLTFKVSAQDNWHNVNTQSATIAIEEGGKRGLFYLIGGAALAVGASVVAFVLPDGDDSDDNPQNGPARTTWPNSSPPRTPQ